jgi:hypothetical protein
MRAVLLKLCQQRTCKPILVCAEVRGIGIGCVASGAAHEVVDSEIEHARAEVALFSARFYPMVGVLTSAATVVVPAAELDRCLDRSMQLAGGVQLVQGSTQQGVRGVGSSHKVARRMHIPCELEGIEQAADGRGELVEAVHNFTSRTGAAGAVSCDNVTREHTASARHRARETLAVGRRAQARKAEQHSSHAHRPPSKNRHAIHTCPADIP